jgi:rhamnose utilization protein RhaD (predicted bifunctional aldolase and dehydrogenase)
MLTQASQQKGLSFVRPYRLEVIKIMENYILALLVAMSNRLGDPALDYAILGEGNTSARIDDQTFWVKVSGAEIRTVDQSNFTKVRFEPLLELLSLNGVDDTSIKEYLVKAQVDSAALGRPSVETVLHAIALKVDGVNFVGHTHPIAVNAILCSQQVEEAISGRITPDEIFYCGPAPVYIPYTDSGLPLAKAIKRAIDLFIVEYDQSPKVILIQNHGFIALGKTAAEVENITAMYVKTARVILGTYTLGGPHFLSPAAVTRIHKRPDQHYRRKLWGSE